MAAVISPCANGLFGAFEPLKDHCVIGRADRVLGRLHVSRVRISPSKEVDHPKRSISELTSTSLTPYHRIVARRLSRGGRVQHDELDLRPSGVPLTCQTIAVAFAGRVHRRGRHAVLCVRAGKHANEVLFSCNSACPTRNFSKPDSL
eukprot:CAMPEP_0184542310 /NCGR_PEP_ID=MMETSP0199_2-20130426/1898_1 /TAXON_ID=1112570 /ORGANISM="Thraustochytrium sp., Strain LLF1b" /LENGTH=146 /DNA_ID=CAMNT_0026936083 /DNA_START=292 /DNA_END=729 /DNA_ORIENTATION=-